MQFHASADIHGRRCRRYEFSFALAFDQSFLARLRGRRKGASLHTQGHCCDDAQICFGKEDPRPSLEECVPAASAKRCRSKIHVRNACKRHPREPRRQPPKQGGIRTNYSNIASKTVVIPKVKSWNERVAHCPGAPKRAASTASATRSPPLAAPGPLLPNAHRAQLAANYRASYTCHSPDRCCGRVTAEWGVIFTRASCAGSRRTVRLFNATQRTSREPEPLISLHH